MSIRSGSDGCQMGVGSSPGLEQVFVAAALPSLSSLFMPLLLPLATSDAYPSDSCQMPSGGWVSDA